jgi:hypothetical protein
MLAARFEVGPMLDHATHAARKLGLEPPMREAALATEPVNVPAAV